MAHPLASSTVTMSFGPLSSSAAAHCRSDNGARCSLLLAWVIHNAIVGSQSNLPTPIFLASTTRATAALSPCLTRRHRRQCRNLRSTPTLCGRLNAVSRVLSDSANVAAVVVAAIMEAHFNVTGPGTEVPARSTRVLISIQLAFVAVSVATAASVVRVLVETNDSSSRWRAA